MCFGSESLTGTRTGCSKGRTRTSTCTDSVSGADRGLPAEAKQLGRHCISLVLPLCRDRGMLRKVRLLLTQLGSRQRAIICNIGSVSFFTRVSQRA